MHTHPLFPARTAALDNGDNLLGNLEREPARPTAAGLALRRGVQQPGGGGAAALAQTQGHGNLQRDTTTGCATLGADAQEWGQRVEGERQVEGWVKREVRCRCCCRRRVCVSELRAEM